MALRRSMKNSIKKFTQHERDVREATSNDPRSADPELVSRCCESAQNMLKLPAIMAIIWKRLDDSGRLWRHPYKVCHDT